MVEWNNMWNNTKELISAVDMYVCRHILLYETRITYQLLVLMYLSYRLFWDLQAEDTREALKHDIQSIIVSNHGARQLDGVPATVNLNLFVMSI